MRKQKGLSLIELMISITLGLVLMAGVIQMFLTSRTVYSSQQGISRSQETGRLAIDFIARDVRMAGHYGCFRPSTALNLSVVTNNLMISGLHGNFDVGIIGYDKSADLPNGVATDLGAVTVAPNESILVVRGATKPGAVVNALSAGSVDYGYTTETAVVNNCVGNLCLNKVMVISDCTKARVFLATALSVASNKVSITNPIVSPVTGRYNKGEIMPFTTTVYFIATGAGGNKSLWQKIDNEAPLELLEGVENMDVKYAAADNVFKSATALNAAATPWLDVKGVRIELVVRSQEDKLVPSPQSYFYQGVKKTPLATDFHMYQVFSSTIDIRSRDTN